MADRTSAGIFADQFERLASKRKSKSRDQAAKELWANTWGYDFHPCQMGCDDALIKLGLAQTRKGDDCDIYVYRNKDCTGWDEP